MKRFVLLAVVASLAGPTLGACGPSVSGPGGNGGLPDARLPGAPDARPIIDAPPLPDTNATAFADASSIGDDMYTVYAHADHILYKIDLQQKTLVEVGPFNAPQVTSGSHTAEDTITDLAVAPDGTIYVNSGTALYTADPNDGHVTMVGALGTCGNYVVALSFTLDGTLTAGDYSGDFCKIDITTTPPTTTKLGTLGQSMALAGDIVAVDDGSTTGAMYGTAVNTTMSATDNNNILVKLDPTTGAVLQQIGSTGFPTLFGVAYAGGQVFGFTHDGTGRVVTIDPTTGVGTLFGTFTDPTSGKGIAFAGAGVNPMVPLIP